MGTFIFQSSTCYTLQQLHTLIVQALGEIACILPLKKKSYTVLFILYNAGWRFQRFEVSYLNLEKILIENWMVILPLEN